MHGLPKHTCSKCSLKDICLPMGIDKQELEKLEKLVNSSRTHHQDDVVIRQGSAFDTLYAVKSGMYKSVRIDSDGTEYVRGFHLPGEIIGLDAIYPKAHTSNVIALTNSVLCQIDYEQLIELSATIPALQHQLLNLASKEIRITPISQGPNTAEEKLAAFIHNLSARNEARGYSSTELILSMTRLDIANHLGMAAETISRLFKQLQTKKVLTVKNREITISDRPQLLLLAGCRQSEHGKCAA